VNIKYNYISVSGLPFEGQEEGREEREDKEKCRECKI
jgi:hypothetical protein